MHFNVVEYVFNDVYGREKTVNGDLELTSEVKIRGNYKKGPVNVDVRYAYRFQYKTHAALFNPRDEINCGVFDTEEARNLKVKNLFKLPDDWSGFKSNTGIRI